MTKKNEKYMKLKEILNSIDGVDLHEKRGSRFYFKMILTDEMETADIELLNLSVRASNGLRRAGYHTVGGLCADISSGIDIRKIRNCGEKSYSEIMEKLFLFNLVNLPKSKQVEYILETIKKNALGNGTATE